MKGAVENESIVLSAYWVNICTKKTFCNRIICITGGRDYTSRQKTINANPKIQNVTYLKTIKIWR